MLDLDTCWFRPLGELPSKSGHVFALSPANENVPLFKDTDSRHYWKVHGIREPDEVAWFSSPWFFPKGSQVLPQVLAGIKEDAAQRIRHGTTRTVARLFVMELVKNAVKEKAIIIIIIK